MFDGTVTPENTDSDDNTDNLESSSKADTPVEFKVDINEPEFESVEFFSSTLDPENEEDAGQAFRTWLHDGLLKDKFDTNSVSARLHTIEEGLLLVSPEIFKDFDKENWQRV